MRKFPRIFLFFSLISIGILVDRFTKILFENTPSIPIFGDILVIRGAYNTGVAFSMPIPGAILGILTLALIAAILFHFWKTEFAKNAKLLDIGYALLLSGGISHAYDRIVFGRVFDFIALKHFAIFNVADIMISIWTGLILCFYLSYGRTR